MKNWYPFWLLIAVGLGWILASYAKNLSTYNRANQIARQGEALWRSIEAYYNEHNAWPEQQWFAASEENKITIEQRVWVYFEDGFQTDGGETAMLVVPVDYAHKYAVVHSNSYLRFKSYDEIMPGMIAGASR